MGRVTAASDLIARSNRLGSDPRNTNYAGGDIHLPGDLTKVIRVADTPELAALAGRTIVTSDGTTLLGADDKSGVAVIMAAAERASALTRQLLLFSRRQISTINSRAFRSARA